MLRIHLCQLFYLPAYHDNGFDLMEEPAPISENPAALGQLRRLDLVGKMLTDFKSSYLDHVTGKVRSILQWSKTREANVVVFPEYSVPVEVLPYLQRVGKEYSILIVAGTHRVRLSEATSQIYKTIGLNIGESDNGSAISPIIFPDGRVTSAPKQSKSKWEPNLNVNVHPETVLHTAHFGGTAVVFAVAPCIDSLQMMTLAPFWASGTIRPQMLVCPSMSPTNDQFDALGSTLAANETLLAFCNSAMYGGTNFNIPREWASYLQGTYPKRYGPIPTQNEAILELDVRLEGFHLKRGSVITEAPCRAQKEFLIAYARNNSWLQKYEEIKKDILELLASTDSAAAIEWVDSSLSEQGVTFPQAIVSKLKDVRHGQLVLYSGDLESVKDAMELVVIPDTVDQSANLFSKRIVKSLDLTADLLKTVSDPGKVTSLLECIKTLKDRQGAFGLPLESVTARDLAPSKEKIAALKYVPSESILASFQNRGNELIKLKDIISGASEKVIVVTGMPGIGKTDLVRAFFLKLLADWNPVWINVATGSSAARLVSEIGGKFGIAMDVDSLSTVTEGVFRQKLSKIFERLFSLQRIALVIDDLMDLRRNARDYHHLQAIIEEATKYERFKGSRILLISSASAPPLWLQRAGVARIHIRGLDEKHIRRTVEYQLRLSAAVVGEAVPDIPQAVLDLLAGHPLAAKLMAEAAKKLGMGNLLTGRDTSAIATRLVETILPDVNLSEVEKRALQLMSVFRVRIDKKLIAQFCDEKVLASLAIRAVIDFDGSSYAVHPIIRDFCLKQVPFDSLPSLHKTAVLYFDSVGRKDRLLNYDEGAILLETIHHLALAGDMKRLSEIRANSYEELFSSARKLYAERNYDKALTLFLSLSELRPNEPAVWAYVGRCYGRRTQWSDCDEAFGKAIECAGRLKLDTWWIHRDWGHIHLSFNHFPEGKRHLVDAVGAGGKNDPSIIASQAYMAWREGNVPAACRLFETVLRIDPNHDYTLWTYQKLLREVGDQVSVGRADELRKQYQSLATQMLPLSKYEVDSYEEDDF